MQNKLILVSDPHRAFRQEKICQSSAEKKLHGEMASKT